MLKKLLAILVVVIFIKECFPLTTSDQLHFLLFFKVWSILHQGPVERVQNKECYFMSSYAFLAFFFVVVVVVVVVLHFKSCVFIIFISFFDEVSNFRYVILTNQKQDSVIRNCQRNFMKLSQLVTRRCFAVLLLVC